MEKLIKPIGYIQTDFDSKFGIPRQSGLTEGLMGRIVMESEYRRPEAFRGIEGFSHLWLLWGFSMNGDSWSPTVRPPRLGGNARVGVFASRSPFRPNGLGISVVRLVSLDLESRDAPALIVDGIDMVSGTPIYDIKPYNPVSDMVTGARDGFAGPVAGDRLSVTAPKELLALLPAEKRQPLVDILKQDPRPQYIDDPDRIFGFVFCGFEIKFRVEDKTLYVTGIEEAEKP